MSKAKTERKSKKTSRTARVKTVRSYAVLLRPEPEGGFTVRVPELPEIVTYGKNEKEALAMAQDAIALVLEDDMNQEISAAATPLIRKVEVPVA